MRRLLILGLILLLPAMLPDQEETREGIEALLETVDLSEWDDWFRKENGEWTSLPSEYVYELCMTEHTFASGLTLDMLKARLLPSARTAAVKIMMLLGLAMIGTLAQSLSEAQSVGETTRIAFRICVSCTVIGLVFTEIRSALTAINTVSQTGELLLPPIIGFLTIAGMENTALLLSATRSLIADTALRLITACVIPLATVGGVLSIVDMGTERIAPIGKLLHRAAKWILGSICSLFLIVTAVRSVTAGSADGLLMRTTRFAAGSIPSVGSLLSESVDIAFQCLFLVKNALGITGCILVVSVALKPVISVWMTRNALRVSALFSESLTGKPYAELLRAAGDLLHILILSELAAIGMTLMMIAPVFGIGSYV